MTTSGHTVAIDDTNVDRAVAFLAQTFDHDSITRGIISSTLRRCADQIRVVLDHPARACWELCHTGGANWELSGPDARVVEQFAAAIA